MVPSSPLLYDLERLELELAKDSPNASDVDQLAIDSGSNSEASSPGKTEKGTPSAESALWSFHPQSRPFLCREDKTSFDGPEFDMGKEAQLRNQHKNIGEHESRLPTQYPLSLESCEQEILKQIRSVLGDKEVSESKLLFAPPWIIEKANAKELANYKDSFQAFFRSSLPRSANIVSSHHFFNGKFNGENGKLKPKCRIVPLGNKHDLKDEIGSDSSTAQFLIIRTVLSMAVLHMLRIVTFHVSKVYPQAGYLERDMRPPNGVDSQPREFWKFLKPAYGLVESGRLWQTTVEPWVIYNYGLGVVPGLPQLFVKKLAATVYCKSRRRFSSCELTS